ncbi:MAG: undecaprenyl-diphosphate phosphatase [Polyangiaceae bacterium]
MSHLIAALLGFVEGLTEYLPVSSTGHLILVSHFLGSEGEGTKSFDIVIQLGAILAVLLHYRTLLASRAKSLISGGREGMHLFGALMLGFIPTAVAGLLFRKTIKEHLFGPRPVAIALAVGGVVMIVVERLRAAKKVEGVSGLDKITPAQAVMIGFGQCVSLWPGASRSMCTIVTGQLVGLSTATAAEFSFLLALPTLGAATLYELYKGRHELFSSIGVSQLAVGMIVSFAVAWAVIASFLRYLRHRGLEPFGYYRIAVAIVVLLLMR